MDIKKKLNKYVDEMPEKKAEEMLPAEALKKAPKKHNYRWTYPVAGLAAAGIVAVAGVSIYNNTNQAIKSSSATETTVLSAEKSEAEKTTAETKEAIATASSAYSDGEIKGEYSEEIYDDSVSGDKIAMYDAVEEEVAEKKDMDSAMMIEGAADEEPEDIDEYDGIYTNGENISAGTLTGGELRDLLNWDNYVRNIDTEILKNWGCLSVNRIEVYVKNDEGALPGIKLDLLDAGENVLYTAVSDVNGTAYLFYDLTEQAAEPVSVRVYAEDGSTEKYDFQGNLDSKNYMEITLDAQKKEMNLDLMFMVDTTGSMGDELEYLKVEIEDVIERASEETGMNIRTSVNFYRDDTDEYIVRYYDFRDDAEEVAKLVGEQSADGGGDFPEAVHKALDNALNSHNWNEDSYKLMFIVLDAPPHEENAAEVLKYVEQASAMGVRIIPIISSGADEETENIFRSYAVMTGGTYLFLDDNSGIGYDHTMPVDSSEYDSEYLNEMIIRVIGEYCGKSIEASTVEQTTEEVQGN